MLAPRPAATRRRGLLLGALATLVASGCVPPRPPARPVSTTPSTVEQPPEVATWTTESQGILSDALNALQTFEVFQAFRVSTAADSSMRVASELAWDPPTGAAWDEATHVTRGMHGRAEQLFLAVTTAQMDPSFWREQRQIADATHDLLDLAEALGGYRTRVDVLPPGDASAALGLLDRAWAQWEAAAARWGLARSEAIACIT